MSDAIRVTRLPSGLTIVTETMERVETVSFGAYVATGTRNETEAENGASHFLEHMAFKGTATRSASDIAENRSRTSADTSTPTRRASRRPITSSCSRKISPSASTSSVTSSPIAPSRRKNWSASEA